MKKETFIIGEVAQAHDGSLGFAHSFIDAIADAGADAVKFQTHIASCESTIEEPWRVKFSMQDKSRYDYWKRMEFTEEQWAGLKEHAENKGLIFMSTPFSVQAAKMLKKLGISKWKLSSGELSDPWLLDYIMQTKLPVIMSTGMSTLKQIDETVTKFLMNNIDLSLLQCTTMYPVPARNVGLNIMQHYKQKYGVKVGLSDHSGTIFPSLAAVALGAEIIEVHVAMSRESFGPDVCASLIILELKQMIQGIRMIDEMTSNPVDKDLQAKDLQKTNEIFSKGICVNSELKKGQTVTKDNIAFKKPGKGIKAMDYNMIIGKKVKKDYKIDEFICLEDLED